MKRVIGVVASLALLLPVLAAGPAAAAGKPIKIGIVDTYSGPASTYTNDVRDAFQMVMDKVNASGGILGSKVEVVTRDDKFKPDIALGYAKELVMKEEVDLLMGTINSAASLAISELAKKEKVPFIVSFSKSDNITGSKGHRYVFQVSENTAMVGRAAAHFLAAKPWKNYWIAGDDYEYGHSIAEETFGALKRAKPDVKMMGETWWKVGTPDFTAYISAIMAAKPDALILCTGGAGNAGFLKAAKATGLAKAIPIYLHTSIEVATLKPLGQDAPEGVIGTANYLFYWPDNAANKAFVKEFMDKFKREPTVGALYGYLAANAIQKAYLKAGKIDKEKFVDALEGLKVPSPLGDIEMRAFDHQAVLPMITGVTKHSDAYPFLVGTGLEMIPGEKGMPSIDEIKKARAAAK
ncbi:MAG: ABC transporter substrate-binding protein [Deltaproteobacteria bacterium]|nr:ABC transporter substrate-binding protein [Deltaproteobacteria bacterium]